MAVYACFSGNICFCCTTDASDMHLPVSFYRAMLYAERGYAKPSCLSVRPSVCEVEVSWSHRLEFLESNFTADWHNLSSLCRPQRHGSTPKGTPPNFSRNRSGVRKKLLWAYKTGNISETVEDTAKLLRAYIKWYTGFRLPPICVTLNDL